MHNLPVISVIFSFVLCWKMPATCKGVLATFSNFSIKWKPKVVVMTIITSRKSLSNNLLIFSKTLWNNLYVFLKIKLHFSIWWRVEKNWFNSEMVNLSKTVAKFSVSYIKKDKLIFRHKNHQQHTAHEHVHALMTHSSSEIAFPQLHGEIQEKSFIGFSRKESLCYCLQLCSECKKEQWIIFTMSYTNNWVQSNNNITNYYIQHTIIIIIYSIIKYNWIHDTMHNLFPSNCIVPKGEGKRTKGQWVIFSVRDQQLGTKLQ